MRRFFFHMGEYLLFLTLISRFLWFLKDSPPLFDLQAVRDAASWPALSLRGYDLPFSSFQVPSGLGALGFSPRNGFKKNRY